MTALLRSITCAVLIGTVCAAAEHGASGSTRTQFLRLCDSTASVLSNELRTYRSVAVSAESDTFSSFYTPLIAYGLGERGIPAAADAPSIHCLVRVAAVEYGEPFTESFFGPRRCTRTVALTVSIRGDLPVTCPARISFSCSDTVLVSDIPMLDASAPPRTKVVLPERSWLDTVLEPAIITVASGVAIYLFFTIRS